VFSIGSQLTEAIRAHQHRSLAPAARSRAVGLLDRVGIANAERRMSDYPHQFSGGMAQRVMMAIALCCNPRLLIADEPTTALDVTMQAQILELLESFKAELGLSVLLISHDLGVVADMADRVAVMYGGQMVEQGVTTELFSPASVIPTSTRSLPRNPRRVRDRRGWRRYPAASLRRPACPTGCRFNPRCSYAQDRCRTEDGSPRRGDVFDRPPGAVPPLRRAHPRGGPWDERARRRGHPVRRAPPGPRWSPVSTAPIPCSRCAI
jgi:peptide/nickel transport system ATP-binding protein